MAKKEESPQAVIARARKRQQSRPFWVGALAILLVGGGVIAMLVWLLGGGPKPSISLFATKTPTVTLTLTPTLTPPPTNTPTITPTSSTTPTLTPSAPFTYRVQDGDSLTSIAEQFNLGNEGVPLLLLLNPSLDQCAPLILVGQELTVPNPDMRLPTPTVVSLEIPPATEADYLIQPGDNLAQIAALFNSTAEDIMKRNDITDANQIFAGQCIKVRMNLVLPTATPLSNLTPVASPSATP